MPQKSHLCVVSGLLELLRSFLQALLLLLHPPASLPCLEVLVQSASPHHAVGCKALQGLSVDVKCFHVSLAVILVSQLWAAFGSLSRCQLSIENVLWDEAIVQAADMPQPTQPALSEQGEHARNELGVENYVLPGYAKDMADASQVEGIESFLLSGICGPHLAAVHQ